MNADSIQSEIWFRVSRSSGPGGQHAQKSSTRVEAIFEVETSTGLSEAERRRVLDLLGPVVRAIAQDERSQKRNRDLAVGRILEQVRKAARPRRRRIETAPTQASKRERLDTKRRQAETKRLRRPPTED
jgi:ribosome-associated protein